MRSVFRIVILGFGLTTLSACGARRGGRTGGISTERLAQADALFAQRADPVQSEAAVRAYLELLARSPDDARVLWRLARAYSVRGYVAGGDAGQGDLITGREYALRCLMLRAEFAAVVEGAGGSVTDDAVGWLETPDLPCLAWATIPWARWMHQRGPAGASIDLEAVEAMGRRVADLGGDDFGSGRARLAEGLTLSLRPTLLGWDSAPAGLAFEAAIAGAPERLTPQVDYALYLLRATGQSDRADALLREVVATSLSEDDPDRPENARAKVRARSALSIPPEDDHPLEQPREEPLNEPSAGE